MKPRTRKPATTPLPPLHNGDRMSQAEFHRRYEAYPEDVKFELIGGIVYMASPLKLLHGSHHPELCYVLMTYKHFTPGVQVANDTTAILGEQSEPQPDLMLRLVRECGGQSHPNKDGYLVGAPELVAEVADSSRSIDLGPKRQDYLEAGVQEYIVLSLADQQLHWFHFPSRRKLKPDRNGVWKSRVFPGLWLDGPALLACDSAKLLATVQQGLASPEHAAFVRRLEKKLAKQ
jgi:Uma2 family endonuclease